MELAVLLSLHLLGSAVWVGGHLILALTVLPQALSQKDPEVVRTFESRFEKIGIPALLIQVVTGFRMAMLILPTSEWFSGEGFSRTIQVKILCLALTILLAVHARLKIIPRLSRDNLGELAWHIRLVTAIAIVFTLVGLSFRFGGI